MILLCITCIILSVILTRRNYDIKSTSNSIPFRIGKTVTIQVSNNEVVDSEAICRRVKNTDLLDENAMNKLAKYMDNHNVKIREGTYRLNQAYSYEEILATLLFVSK